MKQRNKCLYYKYNACQTLNSYPSYLYVVKGAFVPSAFFFTLWFAMQLIKKLTGMKYENRHYSEIESFLNCSAEASQYCSILGCLLFKIYIIFHLKICIILVLFNTLHLLGCFFFIIKI